MISAVILAAGLSRRMGQPKQLLKLGEKTILEHVVGNILQSDVTETIVVLGAYRDKIEQILQPYHLKMVINAAYHCGQGTSVAAGTAATDPAASGILFAMGDQPLITPGYINQLIGFFKQRQPLILQPETGTPAIFNASLREELQRLTGDSGGRQLIARYRGQVVTVPGPSGAQAFDIDTEADYLLLQKLWQSATPQRRHHLRDENNGDEHG